MAYFIIIRGPLGAGKSTVAEQLANALGAENINIDTVLEQHGLDTAPPDAECIPAENFVKANEVILPRARALLDHGRTVIFDAGFYHRKPIEHLIAHLPFRHYAFTLKAPVEVCVDRDRHRRKRHGEAAARAVHSLVSRFDYGTSVDATKPLAEVVSYIRSILPRK
ncbi:MAG: ATP-binding protein [Candidatus Kerfeldbacteria bacterium]|nr:ATP-binding protein [Candidatus Kerfeldbacteria bacterium]